MKKVITALTSVIAILVLGVMMAACSKSVEGMWKFETLTATISEGHTIEAKIGDEFTKPDGTKINFTADDMTIDIKKGGKFAFHSLYGDNNGTWEKKDGKYVASFSGEAYYDSIAWEFDGKSLTLLLGRNGITTTVNMKK